MIRILAHNSCIFITVLVTCVRCEELSNEDSKNLSIFGGEDPNSDSASQDVAEGRTFWNNGFVKAGFTGAWYVGYIFAIFHIIYALHMQYQANYEAQEKRKKEEEMMMMMSHISTTIPPGPSEPFIPYYYQELMKRRQKREANKETRDLNFGIKKQNQKSRNVRPKKRLR